MTPLATGLSIRITVPDITFFPAGSLLGSLVIFILDYYENFPLFYFRIIEQTSSHLIFLIFSFYITSNAAFFLVKIVIFLRCFAILTCVNIAPSTSQHPLGNTGCFEKVYHLRRPDPGYFCSSDLRSGDENKI